MTAKPVTLPLKNKRILITRSSNQAGLLAKKMEALGATVFAVPVITITEPDSWQSLDRAIRKIAGYDWIFFASTNAVEYFFSRLKTLEQEKAILSGLQIAAIGQATKSAIEKHALKVAFCPSKFIAEELIHEFPRYPNLQGSNILWPRTNIGRNLLVEKFSEYGATIDVVDAYKTVAPEDASAVLQQLEQLLVRDPVDLVTLLSAQSAGNFAWFVSTLVNGCNQATIDESLTRDKSQAGNQTRVAAKEIGGKLASTQPGDLSEQDWCQIHDNTNRDDIRRLLQPILIASIGPETTLAAMKQFGKVDIEASIHTSDGLVDSIVKHVLSLDSQDSEKH